jgi:prepilin-type N-terminal cleavage/methylation domain-containing protein/prepilin-type processing-associated H-X9-DG protein
MIGARSRRRMQAQTAHGFGFTLVELLVVMAIIALLVALLLPAIQNVRESGRRTQCLDHMHNLIIAASNYEATQGTLPSGYITDFSGACNIALTVQQPIQVPIANRQKTNLTDYTISTEWGWHALMLSQMEERNLTPDWNIAKNDPVNLRNWQNIQTEIEAYMCPSASLPPSRPNSLAYTNYRGNLGYWPQTSMPLDNGPFYANSNVSLGRDFPDGTMHTILFGETLFGFWGDSMSCCARFRDDRATPTYFDQYWAGTPDACMQNTHFFGFGSYHPDICNFAFADGHQGAVSQNTDRLVLQAIATRNGGESQRLPQ